MRLENHEAKNFYNAVTHAQSWAKGIHHFKSYNPFASRHVIQMYDNAKRQHGDDCRPNKYPHHHSPQCHFHRGGRCDGDRPDVSAAITQWSAGAGFTKNGTGTMALTGNNTSPCHTFDRHDRFFESVHDSPHNVLPKRPKSAAKPPARLPRKKHNNSKGLFRQPL